MPRPNTAGFARHVADGMARFGIGAPDPSSSGSRRPAPLEARIFSLVAEHYRLSQHAVRRSAERGPVTEAKVIAIVLLSRHAGADVGALARKFTRTRRLINARLADFARAERGEACDKIFSENFMASYRAIEEKVIIFITENGRAD